MSRSSSKTSRLLLAICLCLGASVPPAHGRRGSDDACLADPVCTGLYEEARRLSKGGDLQAALVAYQAAYRRQGVPWLLINIGRTLFKLGRLEESLAHYDRYSAAEPSGPPERQQMVREYRAQAEKAAAEKVAAEKAAAEKAAAEKVAAEKAAAEGVEPAPAAPVAAPEPPAAIEKPVPAALDVDDDGVDIETLRRRPRRPRPSLPTYFWAGLGAGGALLIGGAITGGLALSGSQSLQATPYAGPPPDSLLDQQGRVRGLAAATDVLLVVGGATVAAVTVALLVERARAPRPRPAPRVAVTPGGLTGQF